MSAWYEVYDNVDIQLMTRKRAAAMTAVITLALMLSIGILAIALEGSLSLSVAVVLLVTGWSGFAWWCLRRRRRLRRLVWCVKVSGREIVGYDYARRKSALEWLDVDRIDLRGDALLVIGRGDVCIEIAHLFPEFPELSHRIVAHADRYDTPLFVDGLPWRDVDVYDLYPFLTGWAGGNVIEH